MTSRVTLAELALKPIVRLAPDTTLAEAARLLCRSGLGTVFVDTEPPTEFTEDDVVRAVAAGVTPAAAIATIVHDRPMFITVRAPVEEACQAMLRAGRRSLVVLDGHGRPFGVVTLTVAVAAVVEGPPWLGALKVALHIERGAL